MWQGDAKGKAVRQADFIGEKPRSRGGERLFSSGPLTGYLPTTISLNGQRGGHHPVNRQWEVGGACGGGHKKLENVLKTFWGGGLDTERLTL